MYKWGITLNSKPVDVGNEVGVGVDGDVVDVVDVGVGTVGVVVGVGGIVDDVGGCVVDVVDRKSVV